MFDVIWNDLFQFCGFTVHTISDSFSFGSVTSQTDVDVPLPMVYDVIGLKYAA